MKIAGASYKVAKLATVVFTYTDNR